MIYKTFIITFMIISLGFQALAQVQQPQPCATDSLHQHLLNTDPNYVARRKKINEKILDWEKNIR